MKDRPSLEYVKERYKNAKIVKNNFEGDYRFWNVNTTVINSDDIGIYDKLGNYLYNFKTKEWAEIIEYKDPEPETKPNHYKTDSIDVIDFCKIYNLNFNLGNVCKYISRAGKKDGESTLKDLKKALDYLQREIKYLEKSEVN